MSTPTPNATTEVLAKAKRRRCAASANGVLTAWDNQDNSHGVHR